MQLLAQRRAIDAERGGGLALIAAVPGEHFGEQRRFDFVQHERVQAFARLRFDVGEITTHGARNALAQRRLQSGFVRNFGGTQMMNGIHDEMAPLDYLTSLSHFPERPVCSLECTRGEDISAATIA